MSKNATLSIDSGIIEFAKAFSRKINKSLSRIIEDYFIRGEGLIPKNPLARGSFRAFFKGIKPESNYLGRTTYLVLQGEVVD